MILAAMLTWVATLESRSNGPAEAGPLTGPDPSGVGFPIPHLGAFGYSLDEVLNKTNTPMVLDSVSLNQPTLGLRTLAVYAYPTQRITHADWPSWAPPHSVTRLFHRAHGFVVPAHSEITLMYHLRITKHRTHGSVITYHVGGRSYVLHDPLVLEVCAGRTTCHIGQ